MAKRHVDSWVSSLHEPVGLISVGTGTARLLQRKLREPLGKACS